jgi:ribosomal protein S27AE
VLEHRNCGYVGPEADFVKGGARICPKCRVALVLVGGDYAVHGRRYRCGDCDAAVDAPEERWTCRACGAIHAKDDVGEQLLYRYGLDEAQVAKLRVERIPKARVRELLAREGFELQEGIQVTGRSGAEHRLDLLAVKRSGPLEQKVVVGFANAAEEVDSEEVIKLYAKAYDVSAQEIIMVASPRLSEDARQFAAHYHIRVFNADELDRADVQLAL